MRGAWKEVADENRNLNRQQHALSEEAGRLKERCDTLKQAIGTVNLDLADANVEAKKLSAEIVEVRSLAPLTHPAVFRQLLLVWARWAHEIRHCDRQAEVLWRACGVQESCRSNCAQ